MKIFTGEIPKNPCKKCDLGEAYAATCPQMEAHCQRLRTYFGQLSILNQCVEVDMDEMYFAYRAYRSVIANGGKCCVNIDSFEEFLQEQIKKQEDKDETNKI